MKIILNRQFLRYLQGLPARYLASEKYWVLDTESEELLRIAEVARERQSSLKLKERDRAKPSIRQ